MLFPPLHRANHRPALRVADQHTSYSELAAALAGIGLHIRPGQTVAVLMQRDLASIVGVVATICAGATAVPVHASGTDSEMTHVVATTHPTLLLRSGDARVPAAFAGVETVDLDPFVRGAQADPADPAGPAGLPDPPDPHDHSGVHEIPSDSPALIMFTSGTTGPPKGVMLSRSAIAANLDALAGAWAWTDADRLVHALPLYHVHGLVLGALGVLRVGASLHHTGLFTPFTTAAALQDGGTMLFGVPTMYARLADAADADPAVAMALALPRILVSGSAGLPASVQQRITALAGRSIIERYGMSETMITTAVPAGTEGRAGTVGRALPGVTIRIVDDHGGDIVDGCGDMGEILVRSPAMFSGYVGQPDETAASFRDGWFVTGDMATRDPDGFVSIVGRRSADIIKTGGFKVGAGEIEDVLLEHPLVLEAAVAGVPDDDLGERIVAFVVLAKHAAATDGVGEVIDDVVAHAATHLAGHKRPREVRVLHELPRNALGKVQKSRLVP